MVTREREMTNLESLQHAVSAATGLMLRGGLAPTVHQVSDETEFYAMLVTRVKRYLGEFGVQRLEKDARQIPSLLGGWYVFAPTDIFINMTAMEELERSTGGDSHSLLKATILHELAHVYVGCGVFDSLRDAERPWEPILTGPSFNTSYDAGASGEDRKAALKAPIAGLLELGISAGFVEIEKKVLTPLEAEMLAQCIARRSCSVLGDKSVSKAFELLEAKYLTKHAPNYLAYSSQPYATLSAEQFKVWLRTEVNANRDAVSRIFKDHFEISYAVCDSSSVRGYPLLARAKFKRGLLAVLDDQCRGAAKATGLSF